MNTKAEENTVIATTTLEEVRYALLSAKCTQQFKDTAPATLDVNRFQRVAIAAVSQNSKLLECDRQSLYTACAQAASAGLYTDGFLGEAFLIPYKGVVQFQPGYRGLMKLIRQASDVASIHSDVVYEGDIFEVQGGYDPKIVHNYDLKGKRDKLFAAYAIVKLKDGTIIHKVVLQPDIDRAKASSQSVAYDSSPWKKHEPEMWIKTAIKKLAKMLPLSPEVQRVVEMDNNIEAGKEIKEVEGVFVASAPPIAEEPKQKGKVSDKLKNKVVDATSEKVETTVINEIDLSNNEEILF